MSQVQSPKFQNSKIEGFNFHHTQLNDPSPPTNYYVQVHYPDIDMGLSQRPLFWWV